MIQINKPVSQIISFVLNPKNTPLWIDSIKKEETNEWPVKVNSIYKNQDQKGTWNEYVLTELDDNGFTMVQKDGNYHVKYTLTPNGDNCTNFEYYEWVEKDELLEPFTIASLEKLKRVIETK